MAFTLSNLLVEVYRRLGQWNESTATGGSTTTVVDSFQVGEHGDDAWNRGSAFIVRDAGGAGAAPEGQMSVISDYTDSTGTFTVSSAFTTSPVSGDRYGFAMGYFPLNDMIAITNTALKKLGDIPLVDTTTLDSASSQTEYTAALAWKRRPPFRIDYQGRTGDANDNRWITLNDWEYVPATANSTGLLVLPQLLTSRDIRIWYRDVHPGVYTYSDVIYEGWDPELVIRQVTELALEWQNSRLGGTDDFLIQRWNDAKQQTLEMLAERKPWKPKKKSRLMIVGQPHIDAERFKLPDE